MIRSAVGAPAGGILADKLSRRFLGGRMIVQAAGLLLGAGFVYLVGSTERISTLLVAMTIFDGRVKEMNLLLDPEKLKNVRA